MSDKETFDTRKRDKHTYEMERLHTLSWNHREQIKKDKFAGCFACQQICFSASIVEWTKDGTAICPKCGIDSLLPGRHCSEKILKDMHNYWFQKDPAV